MMNGGRRSVAGSSSRRSGSNGAVLCAAAVVLLIGLVAVSSAVSGVRAEVKQSLLYFFPYECPTDDRACCPSYLNSTCGGSTRGTCKSLFDDDSVCGVSYEGNIGQWWFTTNFDTACVCNGNYYGVACESCAPGWTGDDCNTVANLTVRRNFASLSDEDKQYIIDSFVLLKNTPSPWQPDINWYDYLAGTHFWSMRSIPQPNYAMYPELEGVIIDPGHDGPSSPIFHRRMVWEVERAMQIATGNESWAMPYWNWTSTEGNNNDEVIKWFGGDGETAISSYTNESCRWFPSTLQSTSKPQGCDCLMTTGPFANWPLIGLWGQETGKYLQRAMGCQQRFATSPPTQDVADFIVTVPIYYSEELATESFRQLLGGGMINNEIFSWPNAEGTSEMHKRIHRWIGGTLVGNSTASDPLFYMLHGYADFILDRWIRNADARGWLTDDNAWPTVGCNVGQNFHDCTAPYMPLVKHSAIWTPSYNLGYTFDWYIDCEAAGRSDCEAAVATNYSYASLDSQFSASLDQGAQPSPEDESFFFPIDCTDGTCCPSYNDEVCGGSVRGTCSEALADDSVCDVSDTGLSGLWWFTDSFTYVCVCNDNYWGSDCGSCAPGWEGDDCSTQSTTLVRRNFLSLTDDEKQVVSDAFATAKSKSHPYQSSVNAYDYLASLVRWQREYGATGYGYDLTTGAYPGASGPTSNRRLLLEMESILRDITGDDTFTLPYWDWSTSQGTDNDDAIRWFGGNGAVDSMVPYECMYSISGTQGCNCSLQRGQFSHWAEVGMWGQEIPDSMLGRGFGCLTIATTLPTADVVESLMTLDTYHTDDSNACFWKALSGLKSDEVVSTWPTSDLAEYDMDLHARVMMWLGSTGSGVTPASDPMFYLHVAYADLLFERFLRNTDESLESWPTTGLDAGNNRYECVAPFFPLQRNSDLAVKSTNLGYTYDYFTSDDDTDTDTTATLTKHATPEATPMPITSSDTTSVKVTTESSPAAPPVNTKAKAAKAAGAEAAAAGRTKAKVRSQSGRKAARAHKKRSASRAALQPQA